MLGKKILLTFFGILMINQTFGRLLITNVHLDSHPDYIKSNVQLKKVNGRVLISGEGYILQDIESDVTVSFTIIVILDSLF